MKRKLKTGVKIALLVICLLTAIPYLTFRYYQSMIQSVHPDSQEEVLLEIPMGTSLRKTALMLKENGLIKNERVFLLYAKLNELEKIKSGNYHFIRQDDVDTILQKLNAGDRPLGERVTIPEGFELNNIADKLSTMGLVNKEKFLQLAEDKEEFLPKFSFLKDDDIVTLEGYLYPDTYYINLGMDEKAIIEVFLKRFQQIYEEYHLAEELGKRKMTLNEFITMASVVEREAVLNEERPVIAGVFYNRLSIDMPLQSCATVQYILKERKPVLSIAETKIDSPYNTYQNKGLPPAPIASPGSASISATLNPQKTDYLFFVAKGDGGHEFTVTYAEHQQAKQKYLK